MNNYCLWFQDDENILYGTPTIIRYQLYFPSKITLCEGNSGVGKTFYFDKLKDFLYNVEQVPAGNQKTMLRGLNAGKILLLNRNSDIADIALVEQKIGQNYVVCIDNWDFLVRKYPNLVELIRKDTGDSRNIYILMGRGTYGLAIRKPDRIKCQVTKKESEETIVVKGKQKKIKTITYTLGG